jgi:hypothetical protein
MVAHPELMHTSVRPKPSWIPVVAWTFFFGLFGVISAARRAGKARKAGHPQQSYWIAFGATLFAGTVVWAVAAALTVPVYLNTRQTAMTKTVEENIVAQPATAAGVRVTAADCKSIDGNRDGLYAYTCRVTLNNGRSGTVSVLAEPDGTVQVLKRGS